MGTWLGDICRRAEGTNEKIELMEKAKEKKLIPQRRDRRA
jgi:hypothetical protein